jgi:hypothetical protein
MIQLQFSKYLQFIQNRSSIWLVRLSLLRKILRIFCLALVYEEQDGEAASRLQSLSKQLKRIEALYRNVRLPESVRGKGG